MAILAVMRVGDPHLYKAVLEQKDSIEKLAGIKLIAIIPDWKEEKGKGEDEKSSGLLEGDFLSCSP